MGGVVVPVVVDVSVVVVGVEIVAVADDETVQVKPRLNVVKIGQRVEKFFRILINNFKIQDGAGGHPGF